MNFLAYDDLGAKNLVKQNRDGNSQCGEEFYQELLLANPLY